MTVKIGINGFGRIGRLAFRRIFELQLVAARPVTLRSLQSTI
jgi:glyceraldehyde-3-phosphate dehydrogenase/erythrose-4-phosphate dehydrogenase